MAEYREREASYAGMMQEQIKAFADVIVDTHEHIEDRSFQRFLNIMQQADNEQITLLMSILGIDEGLRYDASLPAILFMRLSGIGIDDDTYIEGHMDVSAMTSNTTAVKSDTKVEGSGKIGWGPVSIGVKIHSNIGVEHERKRESDYSAGVKWRLGFARQPAPEGMMKIYDSLMSIVQTGNEINKARAGQMASTASPSPESEESAGE